MNTIVVGNIGTVYEGKDDKEAQFNFIHYKTLSSQRIGRAAGESVTWFKDNEIYREHEGDYKE
jgi:hypothetical protein